MRYIIDFIDSITSSDIQDYINNQNAILLKHYDGFGNVYLIECANEPALTDIVESVVGDNNETVLKLHNFELNLTDDATETSFLIDDDKNWWKVASINTIDFDQESHTHMVRGDYSSVYILDSGIQSTHPEFQNTNIVKLHSFIDDDCEDNRGHGTALASLISGTNCGLTSATLKIVKIFETGVDTKQSDLLGALNAVLNDYISNGRKPSIVNMSWGIDNNEYINNKILQMLEEGMFIVAAAGNSGTPINDITPASIRGVLTIGSYNQNLEPSDFSNYTGSSIISYTSSGTNHGELDGWAPGEHIWAAGLNNTYGFIAGTSASAAIASGAIAYNLSRYVSIADTETTSIFTNYSTRLQERLAANKKIKETEEYYNIEPETPYHSISLGKPNIIDLTDEKYSNSTNKIVTYYSSVDYSHPKFKILATADRTTVKAVFNSILTEKIVCVTNNIPEYMNINDKGIVTIIPDNIIDVYKTEDPIVFDLYNRDGSMGTTIVEITILRNDVSRDNINELVPDDDPILGLVLYSLCSGTNCTPDCGTGQCNFFTIGKDDFFCSC
jgi:hypothetical protein